MQTLTHTQVIQDPTTLYWDIRLSDHFPTLEFRIADVCLTIEEAVMLAGLVKALVRTCYEATLARKPYPAVKSELLKAMHWTAARYGLSANLIDTEQAVPLTAQESIQQLMTYLKPALEAEEDWSIVNATVQDILINGNGASRQRHWYEAEGSYQAVIDHLIEATAKDIG